MVRVIKADAVDALTSADINAIRQLYSESYPGNWFDPRMLQTNQYFGAWKGDNLASIAWIHVYSPEFGVAAIGNVTTHPDCRKQGYATLVTAKLCQSLLNESIQIGLNVKADNKGAISCYRRLGFDVIANYEEFMISRK